MNVGGDGDSGGGGDSVWERGETRPVGATAVAGEQSTVGK